MPRLDLIQIRRGTAAQWVSANPVLASGEIGYETDTNKIKIGNGVTAWNSLAYLVGTITLTGDVTGTGTSSIATTIAAGHVTNAMLAGSITAANLLGSIPASKLIQTDIVLTESQITNLVSDLALKANLVSPSFTTPALGTITAGVLTAGTTATQAAGTSDTTLASTAFVQGLGVNAKRYEATLTQTGTSVPSAQILVNTTGITFTWGRTSAGLYTFTAGTGTPFSSPQKVQIFMGTDYLKVDPTHDTVLRTIKTSSTVITVEVTEVGTGPVDALLSNTSFSVIIYP